MGTQGQFWLILVSSGYPAVVFFVAWFAYLFWRSARGGSPVRFWVHVMVLIAIVQLPYYGMLPAELQIVMIGAALAFREIFTPRQPAPLPDFLRLTG